MNRSRRKTNKEAKIRKTRRKKRRNQTRAKMSSRMRMKNLILQSSKTTTRTLKGSERYASMTKKLKSTQRKRVT